MDDDPSGIRQSHANAFGAIPVDRKKEVGAMMNDHMPLFLDRRGWGQ